MYGLIPEQNELTFLQRDEAEGSAQVIDAYLEARTWGEFWQMLPDGSRDSLQGALLGREADRLCDEEGDPADARLPDDADGFDTSLLPGAEELEFPALAHIDGWHWMPEDICWAHGVSTGSPAAGLWVEYPPSETFAVVDELTERGFVVWRDDELVSRACGSSFTGDALVRLAPFVTVSSDVTWSQGSLDTVTEHLVRIYSERDPNEEVPRQFTLAGFDVQVADLLPIGPARLLVLGSLLESFEKKSWRMSLTLDARAATGPRFRAAVQPQTGRWFVSRGEDSTVALLSAMISALGHHAVEGGLRDLPDVKGEESGIREALDIWASNEPEFFGRHDTYQREIKVAGSSYWMPGYRDNIIKDKGNVSYLPLAAALESARIYKRWLHFSFEPERPDRFRYACQIRTDGEVKARGLSRYADAACAKAIAGFYGSHVDDH
ncbi:MAG: hypothetical protein LC667_09965 [Thioalkalivibrio sp.]|nr:hypothetical protein [Thioalkalivibrio sp.]